MSFSGKSVIVTGSSAGIGQAIAVLFAKEGASVTIHGRSEEKLQKTLQLIEKAGGNKNNVLLVVGDITDSSTQHALVDKTVQKFGQIDVLVNNAGLMKKEDLTDFLSIENYDYVFNVNLRSVIVLTQLAVPHLEKTKGNVINISSVGSQKTAPLHSFYCMTKAALDHFARNFAVLLAPKGIRVNNVNPGYTETDFFTRQGTGDEQMIQEVTKMIPLGRWGKGSDMAEFVVFVASDKASYFTGQCINVDGGQSVSS